jgi:hypothetical protein
MTGPRIFIVVLILIAILFVVGIAAGATRKDDNKVSSSDLNASWLEGLQARLAQPQPLTAQDIGVAAPTSCLQKEQLIVAPNQRCRFLIQRSSSPNARRLALRLVEGASVALRLEQKNAVTLEKNLPPSDSAKDKDWDVYQEGGILSVTCTDSGKAAACRLALGK